MAYVKNHNPGKITMDLPKANYIYELPLLSIGDIHGPFHLSLIFNRSMAKAGLNPFAMAAGYKLNVHKVLNSDDPDQPYLLDANGNQVLFHEENGVYVCEDDSQRIMRYVNNIYTSYTIENPDYSVEHYNRYGYITSVVDKYGTEVLLYKYDNKMHLTQITFRGNKVIQFDYPSGTMAAMKYQGTTYYTALSFSTTTTTIYHYSGMKYVLNYGNDTGFRAYSAESYSSNVACRQIRLNGTSGDRIAITEYEGNSPVNTNTYVFYGDVSDPNTNYSQVEITNHEGVQTRVQYQFGKPLYSYEIVDGDENFCRYYHNGMVQMYNTVDSLSATHEAKLVTVDTGLEMRPEAEGSNKWQRQVTEFAAGDANRYFLLTGWIKSNTENAALNNTVINVSCASNGTDVQFYPRVVMDGKWKFFAYKVHMGEMSGSFLYVYPNDGNVELNDLRLYFPEANPPTSERARMILSEDVLITSQNQIIPIHNTIFTCGSTTITCSDTVDLSHDWVNNYVNFHDLLRYMRNQRKSTNTTEFYYNNGKNVLVSASVPSITVTNGSITDDLRNCCVGKRSYTTNGAVITKVCKESAAFLVCETDDKDGVMLSRQRWDSNMDVISATVDGITTNYGREQGLIVSESVKRDSTNTTLYTRTSTYDAANSRITATDEFGNSTVYTLDSVWGVVKSVTLPDGTVVTDTFDDDMCTMTGRTFGSASGRSNSLTYSGGNLSALQTGDLGYNFTYEKYKLKTIKKNNAAVEEHEHTDNTQTDSDNSSQTDSDYRSQTDSYYPSKASALHSTSAIFDKYGKLLEIVGVLKNSYYPRSAESENGVENDAESNGSSLLYQSVDELRGETSEFSYNYKGLLVTKTVTGEANPSTVLSKESFAYDSINRLTSHTTVYDAGNNKSVAGSITYTKDANEMSADNSVASYTYKVNGVTKAVTTNDYDILKRLREKKVTFASKTLTKTIAYDRTRVSTLEDKISGVNIGTNSYAYDSMGRIGSDTYSSAQSASDYKKYTYDQYGQLVREDNLGLAKTYIYAYNNIGNITSVKAYNYSLDTTPSGTPTTTSFGYTNDKLTTFGGKTIAYNTMGCPTTYEGKTATWARGKLSRLSSGTLASGTTSYSYGYNAFGQRTSRTYSYMAGTSGINQVNPYDVVSCTRSFAYDHAGRLIAEEINKTMYDNSGTTDRIVYLYDESSMVGIDYTSNGSTYRYFFQRNLQGDVTAIFDTSGALKVKYLYDAWGNCTISSETTDYDLANANPIRYRGYYYDDDTGLYYCNARYYSPKWRRFISPATNMINPSAVNGLNAFVYANNNPINVAYGGSNTNGKPNGIVGFVGTAGATYRKRTHSNFHTTYRNLPAVPEWVDTVSTAVDHAFSVVNPIRTATATLMYTDLWDVMRLDGVTELPGTLSQVATGVGWGLGIIGGVITGYEKYASGASASSSIAGGIINAGINIGGMYAASAIVSWGMGLLVAGTALPSGAIVLIGAAGGILVGVAINHVLTQCDIGGNTIEGHLNDLVDWLIFWD